MLPGGWTLSMGSILISKLMESVVCEFSAFFFTSRKKLNAAPPTLLIIHCNLLDKASNIPITVPSHIPFKSLVCVLLAYCFYNVEFDSGCSQFIT